MLRSRFRCSPNGAACINHPSKLLKLAIEADFRKIAACCIRPDLLVDKTEILQNLL